MLIILFSTYSFPPVPTTPAAFIDQNLTSHPTFFGCNSTNAPLVVYIANAPPLVDDGQTITNTTTGQIRYPTAQVARFLDGAYEVATRGYPQANATGLAALVDPEWPACLACAVVDRQRQRQGTARSGVCSSCFDRYCWNGSQ